MSSTPEGAETPPTLSEADVVEYLKGHPEFLVRHESLLARMTIPHERGKAVSLVERQLSVLRDENQQLQRQLNNLIEIAKRNQELNQRIQTLVTRLVGAETFEQCLETLYQGLAEEFHNDAVSLRLFGGPPIAGFGERPEFVEYDAQVFNLFEEVLDRGRPLCGRPGQARAEYLFPERKVESAVLIPVGLPKPCGILALGSADVARYSPSMGTELLEYLGNILSELIKIWRQRQPG